MSIWDDPTLKPTSDYVKFTEVGDGVEGVITEIGTHTFSPGTDKEKKCAKLNIETANGDVMVLTASQLELMTKLADLRPDVGDRISVRFSSVEKRPEGRTLKHFDVKVTPAGSAPAAPAVDPDDVV